MRTNTLVVLRVLVLWMVVGPCLRAGSAQAGRLPQLASAGGVPAGIAGDDAPTMREIFAQGYRGSRYSFGYPACPDLEQQKGIAELLDPSRIGVELSETFQWHPEQSTSAIVAHHPEARYFVIR